MNRFGDLKENISKYYITNRNVSNDLKQDKCVDHLVDLEKERNDEVDVTKCNDVKMHFFLSRRCHN